MTDRAQFEAMLNALINEDQDAAKEIFHNIVVAKSREIYEELLAEDFEQEPVEEAFPAAEEDGEEEEATDDEEGTDDEEATDDEEGEENPFGDEEGGEEEEGTMDDAEQSDRILDLEDALEELKAEFEQLMAGEEGEEHMGGDDMGGMDDMDAAPEMDMGIGEEDELAGLMEYVNQVGGKTYNTFGKMGDNGQNTKSIVAGKNDMGGTASNIAQGFSTTTGGTQGGLAKPSTELQDGGNINKPGANAGKTAFKKKEPGHGAEKAGAKETADNKGSFLKQAKK